MDNERVFFLQNHVFKWPFNKYSSFYFCNALVTVCVALPSPLIIPCLEFERHFVQNNGKLLQLKVKQ